MSNPAWGSKRQCPSCGTRFYDLGKEPPLQCIKCGHTFVPELVLKSRKPRLIIKDDEVDLREDDDLLPDPFADALVDNDDAFGAAEDIDDDTPTLRRSSARDDSDIVPEDDGDTGVIDEDLPDDLPDDDVEADIDPMPPVAAAKKPRR